MCKFKIRLIIVQLQLQKVIFYKTSVISTTFISVGGKKGYLFPLLLNSYWKTGLHKIYAHNKYSMEELFMVPF
jgi:hypothetical protein